MKGEDAVRAYTELATALLVWDRADKSGLRHEVTAAEKRLRSYAGALREAGWRLSGDGDEET